MDQKTAFEIFFQPLIDEEARKNFARQEDEFLSKLRTFINQANEAHKQNNQNRNRDSVSPEVTNLGDLITRLSGIRAAQADKKDIPPKPVSQFVEDFLYPLAGVFQPQAKQTEQPASEQPNSEDATRNAPHFKRLAIHGWSDSERIYVVANDGTIWSKPQKNEGSWTRLPDLP